MSIGYMHVLRLFLCKGLKHLDSDLYQGPGTGQSSVKRSALLTMSKLSFLRPTKD